MIDTQAYATHLVEHEKIDPHVAKVFARQRYELEERRMSNDQLRLELGKLNNELEIRLTNKMLTMFGINIAVIGGLMTLLKFYG